MTRVPDAMAEKMDQLELHGIKAVEIPPLMDYVLPILERAEAYWSGRSDAKHALHECMMGRMALWVVGDHPERLQAAIVTEIVEYPLRTACRYVLISGEGAANWIKYDEVIVAWAQSNGCSLMEGAGRLGWWQKLKPLGWTRPAAIYEKEI